MNNAERLLVFQSQVKNVKRLKAASKQIKRSINVGIRKNDALIEEVHTSLLGLSFCAWAEANFSKVLHTPYGFTLEEIRQIKKQKNDDGHWVERSITGKWEKAIQLGLRKVDSNSGNFVPNARKVLNQAVGEFVKKPSELRNKIAHGQWVEALNRSNTNVNADITQSLSILNIVTINSWFECHEQLAHMLEVLIESPKKAFVRDYWGELDKLKNLLSAAPDQTYEAHKKIVRKRPVRYSSLNK